MIQHLSLLKNNELRLIKANHNLNIHLLPPLLKAKRYFAIGELKESENINLAMTTTRIHQYDQSPVRAIIQ